MSPGTIGTALRTSRSLAEAAKALGVNRSTLHRWLEADPELMKARDERKAVTEEVTKSAELLNPDQWAEKIAAEHLLSDTDRVTLDLARRALEIAHYGEKASEQLSAMTTFRRLVSHLSLQAPIPGAPAPRVRTPRPPGADPRGLLN